jgi:hypothetical protein
MLHRSGRRRRRLEVGVAAAGAAFPRKPPTFQFEEAEQEEPGEAGKMQMRLVFAALALFPPSFVVPASFPSLSRIGSPSTFFARVEGTQPIVKAAAEADEIN